MTTLDADSDASRRPRPRRPLSMGRRVGIAVFWLAAAYVVGGAALSILPALYWPEHAPRPPSPGVLACARGIDALERELTARAASAFEARRPTAHEPWLTGWDRRYGALGTDCGLLEGARRDLGTLRAELGARLIEHEHATRPVRERVRRAVDAFLTAPAPGKT